MLDRRVVVGGQRHAALARKGREPCTLRRGPARLALGRDANLVVEPRVAPALLARVVGTRTVQVDPLPLPGRVVHERKQTQPAVRHVRLEQRARIRRRQLASHVEVVIGAQRARGLERVEHVEQRALVVGAEAVAVRVAHADGVEHRGDAPPPASESSPSAAASRGARGCRYAPRPGRAGGSRGPGRAPRGPPCCRCRSTRCGRRAPARCRARARRPARGVHWSRSVPSWGLEAREPMGGVGEAVGPSSSAAARAA